MGVDNEDARSLGEELSREGFDRTINLDLSAAGHVKWDQYKNQWASRLR